MIGLSPSQFVQKSLDLNLFFLRIMKEHSLFLESGFLSKDSNLALTADNFQRRFDSLLAEAVRLAQGNVSQVVLSSGEVVTDKTLQAEEKTQFLSGISIDTGITRGELQLVFGSGNSALESQVSDLNNRAITATQDLIYFKTLVLDAMLTCTLFTFNFPLLIEHIRREAEFFVQHLQRLQRREIPDPAQEIIEEKVFWDRIMAEHSLFIVHLLDPSETSLINQADLFARQFFKLEDRALDVRERHLPLTADLLSDELEAAANIKSFKNTAEDLILACSIRSLILPLLADHVLREANHFLAILAHTPVKADVLAADKRHFRIQTARPVQSVVVKSGRKSRFRDC